MKVRVEWRAVRGREFDFEAVKVKNSLECTRDSSNLGGVRFKNSGHYIQKISSHISGIKRWLELF